MASEKDFEILDEYAGNRLNAEDKAAFEQQLASDAELKNELALQRKIIEGVRSARRAELKKMLNDIPLSSIPGEGMSVAAKVGLWVLVAGLVGTGLYFYFNQEDSAGNQPVITNEVKEEGRAEATADESASPEGSSKEQPQQENLPKAELPASEQQATKQQAPKVSTPDVAEEKPVEPSTLDVFDPSQDAENADETTTEENKPRVASKSSIVVETEIDKRYNFHYQFRDDKLYLYGSFEKNLYEIMEFFSNNKRTMFLFYKDNYYLLNEGDTKVKPLIPINDATLLKKLRDSRIN